MMDTVEFLVVLCDYWLEIRHGWSLVERMRFDAWGIYGKGTWNLRWLKAGVFNLDVKGSDRGFLTKCPLGSPTLQKGTGQNGTGCAGRFQLPQSVLIKMIGWAEVQVVWSRWFVKVNRPVALNTLTTSHSYLCCLVSKHFHSKVRLCPNERIVSRSLSSPWLPSVCIQPLRWWFVHTSGII